MKKKSESAFAKYIPYIRNKYTLTFLGFLIWLSFFDRNDFITTMSYRQKLSELKNEKEYYEEEILKNKAYLNDLQTNRENLEKFGREKYFMKRDNEDVFVILDKRKKVK
ncbi:MAG: septum formation initiator family protein [Bacteroidia bacterium]